MTAVIRPGRYFEHYFVQLMLSVSFVAGSFFAIPLASLPGWIRWIRSPRLGFSLLGLLVVVVAGYSAAAYRRADDIPRRIADRVGTSLTAEDAIYAGYHQILYHLLDRLPPNRYVQPSLTRERRHIEAMDVLISDELARIARASPRFLIFVPEDAMPGLHDYAGQHFERVQEYEDGVVLFERSSGP